MKKFIILTLILCFCNLSAKASDESVHIMCDSFLPDLLGTSSNIDMQVYEFYIDDANKKLLNKDKQEWGTKNYTFDDKLIQVERILDYTYMFVTIDRLKGAFQVQARGLNFSAMPVPKVGFCKAVETGETKF